MAYQKPTKRTTPAGVFKFPKFLEPDTKYNADGEFSVKLVLPENLAGPMIEVLEPMHAKAVAEGQEKYDSLPVKTRKKTEFSVNDFYSPIYDEETEEPTGDVEFNFKTKASGTTKAGKRWTKRSVPLFDARGNPCPKSVNPWGGTIGKISYTANPYFIDGSCTAGLSLRLEGAQILELRSGGNDTAAGMGFGEEEGYDATQDDFGGDDEPDTDAQDDDEGGDF